MDSLDALAIPRPRATDWALPTVTGFAAEQAIVMLRKRKVATEPSMRAAGLHEHDFRRAVRDENPINHHVSDEGVV
jgi:hypothetical protein